MEAYVIRIGTYDKKKASALKIESGNFPGHGKLPSPPEGARTGYGIYDEGKWIGFVELTRPYKGTKVHSAQDATIGVGILPKYQKQGLGKRAVAALIKKHPEVKKWKWQYVHWNTGSNKLGTKMGFGNMERKGVFEHMEKAASVMRKPISDTLRRLLGG